MKGSGLFLGLYAITGVIWAAALVGTSYYGLSTPTNLVWWRLIITIPFDESSRFFVKLLLPLETAFFFALAFLVDPGGTWQMKAAGPALIVAITALVLRSGFRRGNRPPKPPSAVNDEYGRRIIELERAMLDGGDSPRHPGAAGGSAGGREGRRRGGPQDD